MVLFNDEITHNTVDVVIAELSQQESTPENPLHFYFATVGGHVTYMQVLTHFLNMRKDSIIVHIFDDLHSAGILMLTDFKGRIKIHHEHDLFFVLHNIDRKINTQRRNGALKEKLFIKGLKKMNKSLYKKLSKIGVPKSHIKRMKKGKDAVLMADDISKLKIKRLVP